MGWSMIYAKCYMSAKGPLTFSTDLFVQSLRFLLPCRGGLSFLFGNDVTSLRNRIQTYRDNAEALSSRLNRY